MPCRFDRGAAAISADGAKPKLSKAELAWVTPLLKVWVAQNAALQLVAETAAAKNALYLEHGEQRETRGRRGNAPLL